MKYTFTIDGYTSTKSCGLQNPFKGGYGYPVQLVNFRYRLFVVIIDLADLDYDDEVEEILRAFIQRERSMDATMKDLWNFLESREEEIEEDQERSQEERDGLKKALQTLWVMFIP